jgi:spermidine synthase
MPGIGWSLGGLGISIGGSNGGPPLPAPGLGMPLGVIGGYGIGVAVPGDPGILGGLTGIVGCWAWAQLIESVARAMAVRMMHFINGSVAIVCFKASRCRAGSPSYEISMKRFVLLDTTPIPDNGGALCLFEYGEDFVIKIQGGDGGQLMNTRMHDSEDALAEIPCRKVAGRPGSRVLIGGLGMGFTLASALKHLGKTAEVVVAELVPGVVEWNRGPLGEKAGRPLSDPRTVIRMEDVAKVLQAEPQGFDAIMLDVDNGPEGLTQKANSWLYSTGGLAACAKALRPKGVLAVWSASADRQFSDKLKKAGFKAEEVQVFAHGNKGTRHTIWIAEKLKG